MAEPRQYEVTLSGGFEIVVRKCAEDRYGVICREPVDPSMCAQWVASGTTSLRIPWHRILSIASVLPPPEGSRKHHSDEDYKRLAGVS